MPEPVEPASSNEQPELVMRPQGQLHDLPLEFRWEVTRRHPYYLVFWHNALLYRREELCEEAGLNELRYIAYLILGNIGVTGEPVDPELAFEELDSDSLDSAFLSGSVQPMTLRSVATMLLKALPPAELAVLGAIFMTAGNSEYSIEGDDDSRIQQRMQALGSLAQPSSPALDSYPDVPLYYIHLQASQRTIEADLETQIRRWKKRRGIGEKRIHSKKLPQYLKVWDLREGWKDGKYILRDEKSFREISELLNEPISTIANQYRSAFQMITGHKFTPELWWRLVAPLKLSCVFQDVEAILSAPMRHHLRSPVQRPVPDSVVSPLHCENESSGIVESESMVIDNIDIVDLKLDLKELFGRGLSNDEIAERLECDPEGIEYVRVRFEEFGL